MKEVENDLVKYYYDEYGILHSKFKGAIKLELDLAKEFINMRHEASGFKNQYWVYHTEGVRKYPKEVRDYSEIHGQDCLHACAAIVNSHITQFIFNAFQKINKSKIPFKAFRTEEEAVKWLRKLKAENEAKGIF